jgi:transcriptional regulator with XRE-family HTH domain
MGRLYDIIQAHIDAQHPYPPSERRVAEQLRVTQTTLSNWRSPKRLIDKEHLRAISALTGVPYQRVLDALLDDIGYLRENDAPAARSPVAETTRAVMRNRRRSRGTSGEEGSAGTA